MRNLARQVFADGGQNKAAIFFVFEEALGVETLNHVGYASLRNFQRRSDIDDAGVALGINQFENAFKVVFNRSGTAERGLRSFLSWHIGQNKIRREIVKQINNW